MYQKREILIVIIVLSISFLGTADAAIPGTPVLNAPSYGNFWINYTWSADANADSFNVSVNGTWKNGTKNTYSNTSVEPHDWVYIEVASYNVASQLLSSFDVDSFQVPNNPIYITNVKDRYLLKEGDKLDINADSVDVDGDTGIFDTDAACLTNAKCTFDPSTGILSWQTAPGDRINSVWQINVTDDYGYSSSQPFAIIVNPYIPQPPASLDSTTDKTNFWVNYTWLPGANTDTFNINFNGSWTNGSSETSFNRVVGKHGWGNISVAGYNATSQLLSDFVNMNTQIPNNPIYITGVKNRYFLNEGDKLYINAESEDADGDTGIFDTNAACTTNGKCKFNKSTGILSWATGPGDGGVYNWFISVTDGYGPSSTQEFKVIVPLNFSMKFIEPTIRNNKEAWIEATRGHIGKYIGIEGTYKNTGEDALNLILTETYNNDREVFQIPLAKGQSLTKSREFYINSTGVKWKDESHGSFNYTLEINVIGYNGPYKTFNYDNVTNISLPIIPISNMKRANPGKGSEPIIYTLEANSTVNLKNISIYDAAYPAKYHNISKLEVDEDISHCYNETQNSIPCNTSFDYPVTTNNLFECEGGYSCIINLATLRGEIESSGEKINDTEYVEILIGSIKSESSPIRSSSGGGGGGGGGMPPSEDFNNIERREVREMFVLANSATAYTFKVADPVMAVSFESSVSENEVPVAVEVLKNRSKNIDVDAPGNLYRYFNIFVGVSGFSKKVSNGVVIFSVNNSWLEKNGVDPEDILLYKWQGDGWVEKNTEIAESRPNQTYYASLVGNFSSFAIVGGKKQDAPVVSALSEEPEKNTTLAVSDSSVKSPIAFNLVLGILPIIGIIGLVYYFKIKLKQK